MVAHRRLYSHGQDTGYRIYRYRIHGYRIHRYRILGYRIQVGTQEVIHGEYCNIPGGQGGCIKYEKE